MKEISGLIAKKVKMARESHGYTLEQMADITGVSKSMLFQIEKGDSNPSIHTLYKISNALRISLSSLLSEESTQTQVIKKEDLTPVSNTEDTYRIFNLFPVGENRPFEIFFGEVEAGGSLVSEAHQKGTQEYLCVFQGELVIALGTEEYLLTKGSAMGFQADVVHSYYNRGTERVLFSNTIYYGNRI
ncbi:MAG: helix-turn-helix domain-containing protein [Epulopiscium sp.]|jgi:transcriptional regulator with XRE-family HTH domain|nr:helix-turn-helix domain-containing protein [Candidatus Epulonipiscium sp.]